MTEVCIVATKTSKAKFIWHFFNIGSWKVPYSSYYGNDNVQRDNIIYKHEKSRYNLCVLTICFIWM